VAVADPVAAFSGTPTTVNVLTNDTDPNSDPLGITGFSIPAHGSLLLSGGSFQYLAPARFVGEDRFIYSIHDGKSGWSHTTVTVAVSSSPPNGDNVTAGLIDRWRMDEGTGVPHATISVGIILYFPGRVVHGARPEGYPKSIPPIHFQKTTI
jgi:hypothetical protein